MRRLRAKLAAALGRRGRAGRDVCRLRVTASQPKPGRLDGRSEQPGRGAGRGAGPRREGAGRQSRGGARAGAAGRGGARARRVTAREGAGRQGEGGARGGPPVKGRGVREGAAGTGAGGGGGRPAPPRPRGLAQGTAGRSLFPPMGTVGPGRDVGGWALTPVSSLPPGSLWKPPSPCVVGGCPPVSLSV